RHTGILVIGLLLFSAVAVCASDHFFPRLKPLFAGLDESKVSAGSRTALAQAKADFQLARHGKRPAYAHYTGTLPYSHSETFRGEGYILTMVNKNLVYGVSMGPEIVIDSRITGGKTYNYDEIELVQD
ncbi:MAG TPA: hypothetical protein VGH65_09190, partial [Verrucomicrobiaceae bacterium]